MKLTREEVDILVAIVGNTAQPWSDSLYAKLCEAAGHPPGWGHQRMRVVNCDTNAVEVKTPRD